VVKKVRIHHCIVKNVVHINKAYEAVLYGKRGIAYDKKGDYARAAADFEMVLKYKPDDSTARELLEMAKTELAKG